MKLFMQRMNMTGLSIRPMVPALSEPAPPDDREFSTAGTGSARSQVRASHQECNKGTDDTVARGFPVLPQARTESFRRRT